jgi:hypothetical protein
MSCDDRIKLPGFGLALEQTDSQLLVAQEWFGTQTDAPEPSRHLIGDIANLQNRHF